MPLPLPCAHRPLPPAPQLLLYIATASEEKYVYNIAGPDGPAKFEAGVAGYEARAFRGCGVVTSSPFEISDDQDSLQMLQRNTQIGEFYRMRAPSIEFETDKKHAFYLDIVIYNEDSDMHTHISFEEALEASCIFEGKNEGPWVNPKDGQKYTKKQLIDNNKDGVWMPVSLVIARPFIEHRMMSAVLAVAGTDTGATLFGPADMQISANTSVKTIEGHYTCHTKSVITKAQNVMVLRDVMCNGYVAGCNTEFFGKRVTVDATGKQVVTYTKDNIRTDINERLTMADGDDKDYPSMLALYEKFEDAAKRDQVISISNRVLPWDTQNADSREQFPGGEDGWGLSVGKGFEGIHYGEDLRATSNQDFIAASTVNNSLCFLGPHRVYSPWSATYQELIPGQGHFGPDALPGDARWRRGESVSRESARTAMVGVEAATHSQMVFNRRNAMA